MYIIFEVLFHMKFYDQAGKVLRRIAGPDHFYDFGPRVMGEEGTNDPLNQAAFKAQIDAAEEGVKKSIEAIDKAREKTFGKSILDEIEKH